LQKEVGLTEGELFNEGHQSSSHGFVYGPHLIQFPSGCRPQFVANATSGIKETPANITIRPIILFMVLVHC
jgi:hypothetical protein